MAEVKNKTCDKDQIILFLIRNGHDFQGGDFGWERGFLWGVSPPYVNHPLSYVPRALDQ